MAVLVQVAIFQTKGNCMKYLGIFSLALDSPVLASSILHLHRLLQQLESAVAASPLLPSMAFTRQLNLERRHDAARYGHGQLSLRYLQGVIGGNSE